MINGLKDFLSGKKTYIAGAGLVLLGVSQWLAGDQDAVKTILEGLTAIFVRGAVSKVGKPQKARTAPLTAEEMKAIRPGAPDFIEVKRNAE